MKKTIALVLIVAISCSLFGCMAKMTPVENFLLATKKMDIASMRAEIVPDETVRSLDSRLANADLDEDSLQTLKALYALVQYTIGETSTEGNVKKVAVTLKAPDTERIRFLTTTQVLVSGETASALIEEMINDGSISKNMMKEYSVSVKMIQADGVWLIPCGDKENADFVSALAIADMIEFLN